MLIQRLHGNHFVFLLHFHDNTSYHRHNTNDVTSAPNWAGTTPEQPTDPDAAAKDPEFP